MLEIINTAVQTVNVNQAVVFTNDVICSKCGTETHRSGSAQVQLTKAGRYKITFSGNVAVPTGTTVGEVDLGIAQGGEVINGTTMRATPAAVNQYFNVSCETLINVCGTCCETITVLNNGTIPVQVDNPNLIVVRVC